MYNKYKYIYKYRGKIDIMFCKVDLCTRDYCTSRMMKRLITLCERKPETVMVIYTEYSACSLIKGCLSGCRGRVPVSHLSTFSYDRGG